MNRVTEAALPPRAQSGRKGRLHGLIQTLRRPFQRRRERRSAANLLPLLIQVLASFSKIDGEVMEEEIDSILGFLRYDYPEAVYSELRRQFREALHQQQDLSEMAEKLSALPPDRKIMLGVQLYDLISRAGLKQEQVVAYYSFMSQLGMAAQAIDIVYQLNAAEDADPSIFQKGASPLESVCFGGSPDADVLLRGLGERDRLLAFRYHDLVLLRNLANRVVTVKGRPLPHGAFCRVYPGERIVIEGQILTYNDLAFYFNAKKNVSPDHVYLAARGGGDVEIERSRSRESALEVAFGLKVKVRALKPLEATLAGKRLEQGVTVEAALDDRILFDDGAELSLAALRRRARAMGGRFHLKSWKSSYLVSNNPGLLGDDDILLSPGLGGEILLKIDCDYEQRTGRVEVLQADRPVLLRGQPIRNGADLFDGDIIRLDASQVLRCDFSERVIEEERNVIQTLEVRDLTVRFGGPEPAIDGVTFSAARGDMVCIMGASGSGKSTLLRAVAGHLQPESGAVLLNGESLYDNLPSLREFIAYIPQDDSFDEHLTIEENLDFAAAIRSPHLSKRERLRRIDSRLAELGLQERRDSVVGNPVRKNLSGGERKRLNIGLDMIGSADVYLFDEPTSGLSSKDSEHVVDILRNMAQNKIVLAVIHQPSSKIFHKFNKALLLDKGGKLVFFGTPREMLRYFAQAEHDLQFEPEEKEEEGLMRPEFIFDVLETPLRDLSGDIIYEENARGQLVPARRYPPDYWRDKFESAKLLSDVRQTPGRAADVKVSGARPPSQSETPLPLKRRAEPLRLRQEWTQFRTLLARAFKSKMRNRANLLTTMVEAPALALLIGGVLRYSESGVYDFASAFHIPSYLFLSLVVAMFLGLTNSADDIIRDRQILQRERNLNIRLVYYIAAKTITLALFGAVQCALFLLIGNAILDLRGMFLPHFFFLFLTSLTGISIGLLVSALVHDAKTAANIVPLVLVPQIILGGALIKYEEMNRNFDFVHALTRFFSNAPEGGDRRVRGDLEVPLICEFMPIRWSYEAAVVAQAKLNPLTARQERLNRLIKQAAAARKLSAEDAARLESLKELLALVSGLEAESPRRVWQLLREADKAAAEGRFDRARFATGERRVSAEQLFVNQKISDLVSKAEFEEADYRQEGVSVFFGRTKLYFGLKADIFVFNSAVLALTALLFLAALHAALSAQMRVRPA